jgi:hypothetical protein
VKNLLENSEIFLFFFKMELLKLMNYSADMCLVGTCSSSSNGYYPLQPVAAKA